MQNEAPKKYTAINEITGNLVKSRGTNQNKYGAGWEAVFGEKKSEEVTWKDVAKPLNFIELSFKNAGKSFEEYLEWIAEQSR